MQVEQPRPELCFWMACTNWTPYVNGHYSHCYPTENQKAARGRRFRDLSPRPRETWRVKSKLDAFAGNCISESTELFCDCCPCGSEKKTFRHFSNAFFRSIQWN